MAFGLVNYLGRNGRVVSGDIRFQGQSLFGRTPEQLRRLRGDQIALVYQAPMASPKPSLRIGDQLAKVLTVHRGLHVAANTLRADTAHLLDTDLWPALERDDLAAFGRALLALHTATATLLLPLPSTALDEAMLDLMAASGAAAWGCALTGHALFALVRGARDAADLRAVLTERLGLGPGRVLVTIADNFGARAVVRDQRPDLLY